VQIPAGLIAAATNSSASHSHDPGDSHRERDSNAFKRWMPVLALAMSGDQHSTIVQSPLHIL